MSRKFRMIGCHADRPRSPVRERVLSLFQPAWNARREREVDVA
jgi:hypothetical protein